MYINVTIHMRAHRCKMCTMMRRHIAATLREKKQFSEKCLLSDIILSVRQGVGLLE